MPTLNQTRCDASGKAFAGSQRQIQLYVNERTVELRSAISGALNTPLIPRWVSPLFAEKYREYRDSDVLSAVGLSRHRDELRQFWPNGGPVWDALAVDDAMGGILLVEAKSHVPEIFGNGCSAVRARSIETINRALAATKSWLGAPQIADWKGALYQSANRLAHLYFFREVLHLPAWLVNVYFVDDPHSPTTRTAWELAIGKVKRSLGVVTTPYSADLLLPAVGQ